MFPILNFSGSTALWQSALRQSQQLTEPPSSTRTRQLSCVSSITCLNEFEMNFQHRLSDLTSGTTRDYAYVGGDNIIYAYTIETRGKAYGFVPPPSEILETAIETWNGIKAMANNLL